MDLFKFKKSIKQLRKALDNKEVGAVELAKEYIERAKNRQSENQYITITEDEALKNAEYAQKMIDSGGATTLTGIPCSIKDNICVSGIRSTNGSRMLEKFVPFYDAEVVQTLKSQGSVLIGKVNMDEFAMGNSNRTSYFGNVGNPHDAERVSGGSSGGSAAAVAADLCVYSLGSDTGGSIRQPAAYCGITGLKPTYGRISRVGVTAFAGSFDTVGTLAKSAEDCGMIMNSLVSGGDYTSSIGQGVKGLKVALIKELLTDDVDSNVRDAIFFAVEALKAQGAVFYEVSMPILQYAAPAYFILASAEGASALSRFDGVKYGLKGNGTTYDEQLRDSRKVGFGDEVKRRIMLGNFVLSGDNMETYFKKALAVKQEIIREFDRVFEKNDIIISPTSKRTAFSIDEPSDYVKIYSSTLYTVPANLAGLPCVSTPVGGKSGGFSKENMPVGLSITGKRFDEATILRTADCVEKVESFERGHTQ